MARMMAWAGVALGTVYVIFAGGGWWGIYSPVLRVVTMWAALVALTAWAFVARRDSSWRPRSAMLPAIVAVLATLAISTVLSRVPRVSLEYLGYAIVLAALYLLLVRLLAHEFFRRRIVTLAVMLFAISVIGYGAQVLLGFIHWWSLIGRIDIPPLRPDYGGLTYNNPSAALTMIALLAVPVVGAFGSAKRRGVAVVLGVLGAVGLAAVASGSRSGWFALGLTGLVGALVWITSPGNRAWLRAEMGALLRRRGVRWIAGGLVVGAAALVVLLLPSILRRVLEGGEDLRGSLYVAAIRIFLSSPFVGTGPGTWVILRPAYTEPGEVDFYIPHAHDIYVQGLAELGLIGAVAGLIVLVGLARLLRTSAGSGDGRRRWWAWACGLGVLYFGLHQVLDSYANMPAFLLAAALPIAWLDSASDTEAGREQVEVRTASDGWFTAVAGRLSVIGGLAVLVATIGLLLQEVPALRQDEAVRAANQGDWAAALAPARSAAATDPVIGSYLLTAGLAADRAGDHAAAEDYFLRVARTAELPEAWVNAAAEQRALGDTQAALSSVRAALRLGYQRPAVAMPAGALALELGDPDFAREAFANAIATIPSLAGDPWWSEDPARAALLPSVIESAIRISQANTPDATWEIPLMTGDLARAVALAPAGDDLPTLAIDAWRGDRGAQDALFAICADDPLRSAALLWCARVADRSGDSAAGARYRETAGVLAVSLAKHGAELRVAPQANLGQQPGSIADLWATYTYRRPGPWDILVPSLVHLQLE